MKIWFAMFFMALVSYSCKNNPDTNTIQKSVSQIKEELLEANKAALKEEDMQIESMIERNNWHMQVTGTGLRYERLIAGQGTKPKTGNRVSINYEIKLISGEIVYSSAKDGLKEFTVGKGGVESGLEEGILLMKKGEKFRFVIPSYLAHGLAGDQDKIPAKATLIYYVELIDLK